MRKLIVGEFSEANPRYNVRMEARHASSLDISW